jgi:hypothetical protein
VADMSDAKAVQFVSTFSKPSKKPQFEEKMLSVAVKEDSGKKGSLLAEAGLDLSLYVPRGAEAFQKEIELALKPVGKSTEKLRVRLALTITPQGPGVNIADPLTLSQPPSYKTRPGKGAVCGDAVSLDKVPPAEPFLFVKWSRGSKKANAGQTSALSASEPFWKDDEPPMHISCTLQQRKGKPNDRLALLFFLPAQALFFELLGLVLVLFQLFLELLVPLLLLHLQISLSLLRGAAAPGFGAGSARQGERLRPWPAAPAWHAHAHDPCPLRV